ncbi:hypothetical protein J2Y45_006680 [Dyadobacter sp. BE34]|uniref:Uncharacterized protein n=1 Tax=Dyadobacter fermentans TaxID=94254 RepID=A0ABU1R864_9BACT|nr:MULTISPECIES: hypothetical protein [Dyadobacter]MDR6809602.1 hypothetical protein [Dyadobacter fermentans]MDR7047280.1 hypothetical protein [Dyadobacter sp. BE242]MDR7201516.1 hypothetical protein [Dyadobacter sp. BE34]MDR7219386.1 hypothetical protein [Dyadobacter sp. BE31]MDR7267220.1 hypothetical protein [Dyadobacter sp. BE32]
MSCTQIMKWCAWLILLFLTNCHQRQTDSGKVIDLTYRDGVNSFSVKFTGSDTIWLKNNYRDAELGKAYHEANYFLLNKTQVNQLDSLLEEYDTDAMDSSWAGAAAIGWQYILALRSSSHAPTYLHNSVNSENVDPVAELLIDISQKSKWLPSLHEHKFFSEMYLSRHRSPQHISKPAMLVPDRADR